MLLAPAALAVTGHARSDATFIETTELRMPFVAPAPSAGALATGGWQRDAERAIGDAFPLRTNLIDAYHVVRYALLRDVSAPAIIVGQDGWLFYASEEQRYVTGAYDRSSAAIARTANAYAARAAWCAAHGIRYVFVLAPNKSTVYPGRLPPGVSFATPTLADRLVPALRARGVHVVDVRAGMRAAAQRDGAGDPSRLLYSKGDTHWNAAGAYLEYRAVMAELRGAGLRDRVDPRTFTPAVEVTDGSDLIRLAGLAPVMRDSILRYRFPERAREVPFPSIPHDPAMESLSLLAMTTEDPALPNAVIFGDSFSGGLRQFLADDFDRTLTARYEDVRRAQFDRRLVTALEPRVVIQEIVERSLVFGPGLDF